MNIELEIEKLILEGFKIRNRYRIGAAIKQELTRLLTEKGIPQNLTQGGEVPSLEGGAFKVNANAKPETIGRQIAQSIYGGFSIKENESN